MSVDHDGGGPDGASDVSLTIGGDAGQGIESSGAGFTRALARSGLHVFSMADYRSRIRGGHNFYQIRTATRPVRSHSDPVDILLALTGESVKVHLDKVRSGGVTVYDQDFKGIDEDEIKQRGVKPLALPLAERAGELGSKVMMNTLVLGVAAGLLDFQTNFLTGVIRDSFAAKQSKIVEANLEAISTGHRWGAAQRGDFSSRLRNLGGPRRMALHGNQAFCLGAAAAGCGFVAAYPMTPGTSVFEWMVGHSDRLGIVTKHAEDEISAMCMAVGAAHAGARSMTTTSGGGFSLMVEALGMAGMVELPVVVVLSQRGGPSTGLPTRTEQSDLMFALHASQGEFPRIILSPGTVEEAFEAGWRAFNLAEQYQCPVIVMMDQFLSSSVTTADPEAFQLSDVEINRGALLSAVDLDALDEPYRRHRFTASGISPRAIPGHPAAVYSLTTDEHDEKGHITEDPFNRNRMMRKRMDKEQTARVSMAGPRRYGGPGEHLTLICWGSTVGSCLEAAGLLRDEGVDVDVLHFIDLWPLRADLAGMALAETRFSVMVEQNYTGQLARLLEMTVGYRPDATLHKYDGRPFSPQDIYRYAARALNDARTPAWV
ncbi:MAG: 2-oxoacid:acceptor oxidoreductase subunit alpha [Thermaerobacterales bacterium]